jgi:hypothetical protein
MVPAFFPPRVSPLVLPLLWQLCSQGEAGSHQEDQDREDSHANEAIKGDVQADEYKYDHRKHQRILKGTHWSILLHRILAGTAPHSLSIEHRSLASTLEYLPGYPRRTSA